MVVGTGGPSGVREFPAASLSLFSLPDSEGVRRFGPSRIEGTVVPSLGMWGPSCPPVLREPSCAPGQLIILGHDPSPPFLSPPPPSIDHTFSSEEVSTSHVFVGTFCFM